VGASRRGASPILAWMCSKGGLISAIFSILSRLNPKSGVSVTIWTFVNAVVIHRALGLLIIGGGRVTVVANAPPCDLKKWLSGDESQDCMLHRVP